MRKFIIIAFVFVVSSIVAIACGSGNNGPTSCAAGYTLSNNSCVVTAGGVGIAGASNCGAGYVLSPQYGCLPQGGCSAGYGMYGQQCVPATGNYSYGGYGSTYTGYNSACQGSCGQGYVQTQQFGCLPQTGCQACSGNMNGQCVPGI